MLPRTRNKTNESNTTEGEDTVSDMAFTEVLSQDEWNETGGGGAAERGVYGKVLEYVRDSGERFHRISVTSGPFAGKKPSSIATALKGARDGKNAPTGVDKIVISSQGPSEKKGTAGAVFLENEAVEA